MTTNTVITYPIPPYSNVPIEPQFYQPRFFFISNIALGLTTIVTTTANMNYVIGQNVRLTIPSSFGSIELNEQSGYVISIPAPNQVEVNIFSLNVTPFNSSPARTQPQIMAIGGISNGYINSTGRVTPVTSIPGSFINISPV